MNWQKLPLLIVTCTIAAMPTILFNYHGPDEGTAQIFAGFGMAIIFALGLGTVVKERVWNLGKTSQVQIEAQLVGIIMLAISAATLSAMAIAVTAFFGLAVFAWLWACLYVFFNQFFD